MSVSVRLDSKIQRIVQCDSLLIQSLPMASETTMHRLANDDGRNVLSQGSHHLLIAQFFLLYYGAYALMLNPHKT